MNIDPIVQSWKRDPEFTALDIETQRGIVRDYFRDQVREDVDFNSLNSTQRIAIETEFIDGHIPPSRSLLDIPRDLAVAAAQGIVDTGQAAVGLLDIPTGGMVGNALQSIGYDTETTQTFLESLYSPAQQAANRNLADAEGFTGTLKSLAQNPSTIATGVVRSTPAMLGGGAIGRGLVAAGMGPVAAGAVGEGMVTAGMSAEDIRQQTGDLTIGQTGAVVASGAMTSVVGVIGGRIAQKIGIADPDTLLASGKFGTDLTGIANRITGGGISEGVLEEMPQSAQEQIWMNAALNKPLLEGVPEASAQGLAVGGAMGGGANVIARTSPEAQGEAQAPDPTIALSGIADQLDKGEVTVEDVKNAAPQIVKEFGVSQADIDGLLSVYEEQGPDISQPEAPQVDTLPTQEMAQASTFDDKLNIAQQEIDKQTAPGPLQQLRERNQRVIDSTDIDAENRKSLINQRFEALRRAGEAARTAPKPKSMLEKIREANQKIIETAQTGDIANPFNAKIAENLNRLKEQKALPDIQGFDLVGKPYGPAPDKSRIPERLRPAIQRMREEVYAGDAKNRNAEGHPTGSTYPDWFKMIPKREASAIKLAGGVVPGGWSRKEFDTILNKAETGQKMTDAQKDRYQQLLDIAEKVSSTDREIVIGEDANEIERRGFVPVMDKIPIGDIKEGDKVLVTKDGKEDVLTHQGFDEEGNAILKDGTTIKADPFEMVNVDGIKSGDEQWQSNAQATETVADKSRAAETQAVVAETAPREMGQRKESEQWDAKKEGQDLNETPQPETVQPSNEVVSGESPETSATVAPTSEKAAEKGIIIDEEGKPLRNGKKMKAAPVGNNVNGIVGQVGQETPAERGTAPTDGESAAGASEPQKTDRIAAGQSVYDDGKFSTRVNPHDETISDFSDRIEKELGLKQFHVFERADGSIELNLLVVPRDKRKSGIGSRAVEALVKYADSNGKRVYVNPAVDDDFQGTTSRARLVKFYKRFGFVENKGRNKDFTFRGGMYRNPSKYSSSTVSSVITPSQVVSHFKQKGFTPTVSGDTVTIKTPSGELRINVADTIVDDDGATISIAYGRKAAVGEKVAGSYFDGEIKLKRDLADLQTLDHELFHHMKKAGLFTIRENLILNKHGNEEAQARWIEGQLRERSEPKGIVGKIIQKVKDFVDSLVNAFIKPTERGIVRGVESGKKLKSSASTETQNAEKLSTKVADDTPDPQSEKVMSKLRKLYTTKGSISPAKTKRMIDRYETLIKDLDEARDDISAKQKLLEAHIIKTLPPADRFRVMKYIKQMSAVKTKAARENRYNKAIDAIEEVYQRVEKNKWLEKLDDLFDKKEPKVNPKGTQANRGMESNAHKLFQFAKEAMAMTKEDAYLKEQAIYQNMDNEGRAPTPDEIAEINLLHVFAGVRGESAAEVQRAYEVLNQIAKDGRMAWLDEETKRKERLNDMAETALEEFSGGKGAKPAEQEDLEKMKTGLIKRFKEGLRSFDDMHQSFEFLLDKLTRYDKSSKTLEGKTTEYFADMVHAATNAENTGSAKYKNLFHEKLIELYGKKNLVKKLNQNTEIVKKTGVYREYQGKRVEKPLSQNMAYKLWQMFQQPSIQEEMLAHGYTAETKDQLEKFIKPEVMKWAKWQIEEFYPQYREGINDVYKKLFYIDMPMVEGYSPISRRYEGQTQDEALLGEGGFLASVLPGGIKSRTKNMRDFNILDGDSVLMKHIVEMEHFKAWGIPMQEMRSVLGRESVQTIIKQYHGKTANNVLKNFMDQFAQGGVDRAQTLNGLDKLRSNFTKSAIGANPVVFLKQLSSIPAYMMDIPVSSFITGMTHFLTHPATAYKTLMNSEHMKSRYDVGFERDIMLALQRSQVRHLSGKKSITDMLMITTTLGDKAAIVGGGWSVYRYNYKKALKAGLGKAVAHKKAITAFERATKRSQQAGDIQDLAHIQRMGSLAKLFTMFMTSPTSYYRNAMAGYRNFLSGRGSQSENLKRIAVAHFVLPMIFQWVASGFPTDEWDEEDIQAMKRSLMVGPLNGLFIARDAIEGFMTALFEGKVYQSLGTSPPLTTISNAATAAKRIGKDIDEGWDDETIMKVVKDFSIVAGNVTGVPVRTMLRTAKGIEEGSIKQAIGYKEKDND